MNYSLRIFILLAFIVSNTYEINVSTRIWNPEVLPVVGENITLACIYTPPTTSRLLSWQHGNGDILATDRCTGMGCRKDQNVPDMSKYSFMADNFSGNLTIRDLTLDDSGRYQCKVFTDVDSNSNGIDLNVMLSGKMFPSFYHAWYTNNMYTNKRFVGCMPKSGNNCILSTSALPAADFFFVYL